ncbi:MAG: ABC transporter substrate-binding protein [Firmicutes bacterium]|nr:ABC transporter substrate-binding protein [Bacillota bacterium]
MKTALLGRNFLLAIVPLLVLLLSPVAWAGASGTITLYTSESLDQVSEMAQDFEQLHPGVKVEIFRSGTGPVIAKLQAEMEAGEIQADVIWFADIAFFDYLAREDLLLPLDIHVADLPEHFRYAGGRYHEVRQIFNVIAYNTRRWRGEPPTSWKDMLHPNIRGRIAMASPLYSGAAFSTLGTLVNIPEFGWSYFEQLQEHGVVIERSNGVLAQKLASGEYAMVSVVDFMIRNLKNQGSPVEHIWPDEGAILIPTPVAVLKTSRNPGAATAFVEYLLSERGQRLFVKQGYIPVRPNMGVPPGTPDLERLQIAPTDSEYIQEHREELKTTWEERFES